MYCIFARLLKRLRVIVLCIAILFCFSGCGVKEKTVTQEEIVERLLEAGVPEKSIREYNRENYKNVLIIDNDLGHASINIYDREGDAHKAWDNLDNNYDNIKYSNETTAVGDLRDVCDASIEEWIHWEKNVIVSVEQFQAGEWAVYIGEDGEEYYADGTKVSDAIPGAAQRNRAVKLEELILDCLGDE